MRLSLSLLLTLLTMTEYRADGLGLFDSRLSKNADIVQPVVISAFSSDRRRHRLSVASIPDHVIVKVNSRGNDLDLWVTRTEDNTVNIESYSLDKSGVRKDSAEFSLKVSRR
ncbi:uncharacterized protein LOC106012268 [Aplysia californica]|uniref:Uncharacterized protein LOC106012268 n=1 Tax=Aplysia californica TaxID=6500 RepID=A0ABM1A3K0_APLCA|nr:uncharacterized protein LOC106012268 [Aplysia californica]